jgi:DeoR/GlpR family transcriptional regulator of sugar metabolism
MDEVSRPKRLTKSERREQILQSLRLQPHRRIADLSEQFGVTTETIRRDVKSLSRQGRLQRAYGGASAIRPGARPDLGDRQRQHASERDKLARLAAAQVVSGQSLMIDAGSTTIEFARHLAFAGTPVRVVTNSFEVAITLGDVRESEVMLIPGRYVPQEGAVVGTEATRFISRFSVDAAFLGGSALSAEGVSEGVGGFAAVKKTMLERAREAYFLIHAGKFDRNDFAHVASLDEVDKLVTDRCPSTRQFQYLKASGVTVLHP